MAKAVGRTVPRDNVSFQQLFGRLYGSGRPSKAANRSVSVFGPVPDRLLFGNGARCRTHPFHHLASTRLHELLRPHVIQALGDALLAAQLGNAVVTAQAVPPDPHLMFRREMPPGCPAESFTTCFAGYLAIEDLSLIFVPLSLRRDRSHLQITTASLGQRCLWGTSLRLDSLAVRGNDNKAI